jgi:hypothetical protein
MSRENVLLSSLPPDERAKVFGVDYARLTPPEGGELFITEAGWPLREHLMPASWYPNRKLPPGAIRLDGATGTVYRVRGTPRAGRPVDLVVKFSRFAQPVPIHCGDTIPEHVWQRLIALARFNSPFEEVAMLEQMRNASRAAGKPILTKRAYAIYSPPNRCEPWQLGRSDGEFEHCRQRLATDQSQLTQRGLSTATLQADRDYIVLFGWVHGQDAERMFLCGAISQEQMHDLSRRVRKDLADCGYHVLDNKPKHYILRRARRSGELLRRHGKLVYSLIDFELLADLPSAMETSAA